MKKILFTVIAIFLCTSQAYAQTAFWDATDASATTTEMRMPVDIGASDIPSYISVTLDVATGVCYNNSGNIDVDTGFTYVAASGNPTATGTFFAGVGYDCTGAVDCDFGSADITDMTFITDGGTVTIDGDVDAANFCDAAGSNCVATSTIVTDGEQIIALCIPLGTETGLHTTGTAKYSLRAPAAFTVTDVRASLNVAATGGTLFTVDINDSGTTIISTKLTIDASELTSETAATPPVISDSAIGDDALLTFDIDAIGSTLAGEGGKVCVIGTID